MNDKSLMEDLLMLEKGVCDLYMHGAIESSSNNVHRTFANALNESLCMQSDIYGQMSAKGWYAPQQAEQTRVNALKQKFSAV